VVLQVPNVDSWQFKMLGARWSALDIPRHLIDYPTGAMVRLLRDSRFEPRRIRNFNMRDNAPALVSSLWPLLDPVSRAVQQRKRNVPEAIPVAMGKHLLYFSLVLAATPLAILEAACGHGATIMIEARKDMTLAPLRRDGPDGGPSSVGDE
jgi:hypothetical protein